MQREHDLDPDEADAEIREARRRDVSGEDTERTRPVDPDRRDDPDLRDPALRRDDADVLDPDPHGRPADDPSVR